MVQHLSGPFPLDDPRPGVTFAVDDVEPAEAPLPTSSQASALSHRLGRAVLVSDGDSEALVSGPISTETLSDSMPHPLFETVHRAFSEHRPLVLSPDAIWLTIAQGVAHHITLNAEQLRGRIVSFKGKQELVVRCGKPAAQLSVGDWSEVIGEFSAGVRAETAGGVVPSLECSFSTTSPASRVASQVCLLHAHKRYFDFVLQCICGFPQVTVLGTPDDWSDICDRVTQLRKLDLGWWVERLEPICAAFVETAAGTPDVVHWKDMYKLRHAYGTDEFNGWFASLFAYTTDGKDRPTRRNPFVLGECDALTSHVLPNGLATAPCRVEEPMGRRMLEFVGGFTGVRQLPSLALEPAIGWAVADGGRIPRALLRIQESELHRLLPRTQKRESWGWLAAAGLIELLEEYESVELYADDPTNVLRIGSPRQLARRRDGDEIIVGVTMGFASGPEDVPLTFAEGENNDIVIAMEVDGESVPIASSFEAFLERCLDEGAYFARPRLRPARHRAPLTRKGSLSPPARSPGGTS